MLVCVGRRAIGREGDSEESKTEYFYIMISNCTCVKYRLKQGPGDIRYKKLSPIMLILYEQRMKELVVIRNTKRGRDPGKMVGRITWLYVRAQTR
jgi:hypothetical protein